MRITERARLTVSRGCVCLRARDACPGKPYRLLFAGMWWRWRPLSRPPRRRLGLMYLLYRLRLAFSHMRQLHVWDAQDGAYLGQQSSASQIEIDFCARSYQPYVPDLQFREDDRFVHFCGSYFLHEHGQIVNAKATLLVVHSLSTIATSLWCMRWGTDVAFSASAIRLPLRTLYSNCPQKATNPHTSPCTNMTRRASPSPIWTKRGCLNAVGYVTECE